MDDPSQPPTLTPAQQLAAALVERNEFDQQFLLAYLRDRDAGCPLCGYNLRGLTSGRCPECGQALRLRVSLAEPFLAAWVTTAAAVFAGSGCGLFVLGILGLGNGWPRDAPWGVHASLAYFLATIPAAGAVLGYRRRFLRLGRSTQWRIAVGCVLATLAAYVAFFASL